MGNFTTTPPQDTTDFDYVLLSDLADEIGMDRSHLRRYAIKNDIELLKIRTPQTQNQKTLVVTTEDAELIKLLRSKEGFTFGDNAIAPALGNGEQGYFYLILLVPELSESRIKIGFAGNLEDRTAAHRTTCPTLKLVKAWPCKRSWEKVVIDCASAGLDRIGIEVFDCPSIDALISRIDAFFALMPTV